MKFLVTGSLRSARGPRALLTFALLFFLLFLASHFVRELQSLGFWPHEIAEAAYGGPFESPAAGSPAARLLAQPPAGLIPALEDFHIDVFLFSVYCLFLAAVLYQCRIDGAAGETIKRWLLFAIFALPLAYLCARFLTFYWKPLAWVVFLGGGGMYAALLLANAVALRHLYRPLPADARSVNAVMPK